MLFRRARPLHEQLAAAAGMTLGDGAPEAEPALAADVPSWDGEARGEPGIHGVPRVRRWDAVVAADAPELRGDLVRFVALPDGTLILDEDEPDGALSPLAEAVEASLAPPYRAEAIRRAGSRWAVAAVRVTIVDAPGLEGEEAELVVSPDGRTFKVDGRPTLTRVRPFEEAGEAQGSAYVVRATRVDGDSWQIDAMPL